MTKRAWNNVGELAALLLRRAEAGKNAVLAPDTAMMVANIIVTNQRNPSRDEIALVFCTEKCTSGPCYICKARANEVVSLYGQRLETRLREPK